MVRSFNVRTSLLWFRTVSVLSQGVHGARPHAVPSCSAPKTTSSIGPSLTGHWTNDFMAANPADAPSGWSSSSRKCSWVSRRWFLQSRKVEYVLHFSAYSASQTAGAVRLGHLARCHPSFRPAPYLCVYSALSPG